MNEQPTNINEPNAEGDDADDIAWGMEAIGALIDRSAGQARYLYGKGVFGDAVKKLGHRTFVGSKRKLREIILSD